ncbi:MAG: DUF1549 domain-containing protein [Planctomycetaceae bacterium]
MSLLKSLTGSLCVLFLLGNVLFAGPTSEEVAKEVDALINDALQQANVEPAPLANDEDFLRRVCLDIAGTIPSPEEATLFGLDPSASKRAAKIDQLLASDGYAKIWASYWKDVIYLRATEQRAAFSRATFESWLKDQLAENRAWDEITHDLLTATGTVSEDGQTGLIFAHTGQPQELAAEISRVFLGIQMSCANCHDHPTDQWKREDFHQLAAYLPRVSVRRSDPQDPSSWVVVSLDDQPGRGRGQDFDPARVFQFMDRNRDGQLTKDEARGPIAERFDEVLARVDADKNKMISKKEFEAARPPMDQPGRGSTEYFMPDLNDPSSQGKLTQPVFFLEDVKGPRLPRSATDTQRRNALSEYITSKSNPWFAKAFVNRIWGEMLGRGFYMPIDDMGPERTAQMEAVLECLADGFAANDYDIKWLFRTIALTNTYQRKMGTSDPANPDDVFASATPTRLRSDQIYGAVQDILGGGQSPLGGRFAAGDNRQMAMAMRAGRDPAKIAFGELFGFDPSTPQEDLLGNVPQALFMMNSPQLNNAIAARPGTRLGEILRRYDNNEDALSELYLLVLTRQPTDQELKINEQYISDLGNRAEAFEDIMWSLLNSTEFISKR